MIMPYKIHKKLTLILRLTNVKTWSARGRWGNLTSGAAAKMKILLRDWGTPKFPEWRAPKVIWYPILTRACRHNLATRFFLKATKFMTFSNKKYLGRKRSQKVKYEETRLFLNCEYSRSVNIFICEYPWHGGPPTINSTSPFFGNFWPKN